MIVNTKHGPIYCDIYRDREGLSDNVYFCRIIATDKLLNEMGHLNFSIKENGDVWLYHIQTNNEFGHRGAGTALLSVFEFFLVSSKNNVYVEGRFCPENEFAEPFYKKNGYNIWEDSYRNYISKNLCNKNVLAQVGPMLEGEIEVKDYQDYLKQKAERDEIFDTISKRQEKQFEILDHFAKEKAQKQSNNAEIEELKLN